MLKTEDTTDLLRYKEMYLLLFNKLTDITKEIQELQTQAEEMFISQTKQ
ncbi:MAG: hypothetical protein RR263_01140 [Oscillospiraceae bacterium]